MQKKSKLPLHLTLVIGAIGVVYGDIGTSPLYAVNTVFFGMGNTAATHNNILGVISLMFWLLTTVVAYKYIFFVLRANYQGEGGVFALHELIAKIRKKGTPILLLLLVFAAALLLGDGVITPAISVLSAVEGLNIATDVFEPFIIPITLAILASLFMIQRKGTAKVGMLFGPIVVLWFVIIGSLGLTQIIKTPDILWALNPLHAVMFAERVGLFPFLEAMGAVMLVVTGAEALYADLGHFGKRPIRQGWFYLAYWALVLNYLGQGAYLLSGQTVYNNNIFFSMVPHVALSAAQSAQLPYWLAELILHAPLYGMVALATAATIIASQALITGAFSLASQAIALERAPRLNIIHTSPHHAGQIYIPVINWLLLFGCVTMVLIFKSSGNLASAYGLTVAGVMVCTTLAMFQVARFHWNWRRYKALLVFGSFLLIDITIFSASTLKFLTGGYVPVIIAVSLFTLITFWHWGRTFMHGAHTGYISYASQKDIRWLADVKKRLAVGRELTDRPRRLVEIDRSIVFLVSKPVNSLDSTVPVLLRIFMKRNGGLPRHIVLLNIKQEKQPFINQNKRIRVTDFGENIYGVEALFGFMQNPDGISILRDLKKNHLMGPELHRCIVEASEEEIFIGPNARFVDKTRIHIYKMFEAITQPAYHYFKFDTKPGLSKTVIPILLGKNGWRIDIPEYALEEDEERIDPDTREETDLRYGRFAG
ncbi:MAG: KUP/HAK/KT family potassium transporter [Candidatus Nomurabacteria bacterium]|nr:MAG: KUP/HAK/KT family potassium transporter [Candidatus Nomurabacteria bacterium]